MLTLLMVMGLALLGAIAVVLLIAWTRPNRFSVSRSLTIRVPAEVVYPLIDDLHRFNVWNPFLKKDPATRIIYSGPCNGSGAAHDWDGNRNVGKGRVEIVETTPHALVVMRLDMIKPMVASNRVEFKLEPVGATTKVTWTMSGNQPFLPRVLSVLIDCDKMVGSEFDKGLADLKALAEA
jgi:hypothetical protein